MPQPVQLRGGSHERAGRPRSILPRRRYVAANSSSHGARGSLGAIPRAARQQEAWWRRIEELLDRAEQLEATEGATEEAVDLWLHIADRHPDPAAQADCYRRALSLRPSEPRALEALASLYERAEDWEQAVRLLSTLADTMRSSVRRVELEHRVGSILWQRLGDDQRAEAHFLRAFASRGSHMPSVRALVRIYRERGDWEGVAEILLRSEARTVDLSTRIDLLLEAACIHRDHLDAERAVELLESVLAIDPGHLSAIEALADTYCLERSWEQAEALLQQIERSGVLWPEALEQVRSRVESARTASEEQRLAAGSPELDEYEELEIIIELEEEPVGPAIEIDMDEPEEAEEQGAVADSTRREKVEEQHPVAGPAQREQARARGVAACPPPPEEDDDPEFVFEVDEAEMSVELELGSTDSDEVVARIRAKLQEDPRDVRSYRTLRVIFTERGDYDHAWCVCAVMAHLDCATPSERLYYETYRPRRVGRHGEVLTREMWDRIVHPAVDPRVGVIAGAIGRELARLHARPPRNRGPRPSDGRAIAKDKLALSLALERAARMLGVPVPDLHLEPDAPGGLVFEHVVHRGEVLPSLMARANALHGRTPEELACIAGRTVAFLLADLYLMVALPTEADFRATWEAVLELARPAAKGRRGSEPPADSTRARLEKALSSRARAELALAVNGSGLGFGRFDVAGWRRAAEITAQRMGLILCGDPAVAASTLAAEPTAAGSPAPAAQVDALLLYAVSEDYFAVRRHLNGTIGGSPERDHVRLVADQSSSRSG